MAKMEGYEVRRGDVLYDLVLGAGTVRYLYPDDRIAVEFSATGMTKTFQMPDGRAVGAIQRTLFWSQPYIVPPPKNRAKYSAFQRVSASLAELLVR